MWKLLKQFLDAWSPMGLGNSSVPWQWTMVSFMDGIPVFSLWSMGSSALSIEGAVKGTDLKLATSSGRTSGHPRVHVMSWEIHPDPTHVECYDLSPAGFEESVVFKTFLLHEMHEITQTQNLVCVTHVDEPHAKRSSPKGHSPAPARGARALLERLQPGLLRPLNHVSWRHSFHCLVVVGILSYQ